MHDFESVLQRCGIDSPQSQLALNGLLEKHPSVASVRVYKPGGPRHIDISPSTAAVIISVSGRGTNRRSKVNGVMVAASTPSEPMLSCLLNRFNREVSVFPSISEPGIVR